MLGNTRFERYGGSFYWVAHVSLRPDGAGMGGDLWVRIRGYVVAGSIAQVMHSHAFQALM